LQPPRFEMCSLDMVSLATTQPGVRCVACLDCDALLQLPAAIPATYHCPRCGRVVARRLAGNLDWVLSLYATAAVFFILANSFPVLTVAVYGTAVQTTLSGAVVSLYEQHMQALAALVAVTTIAVPAVELIGTSGMLVLAESHRLRPLAGRLFAIQQRLRPWNMVEIFMLGMLVTVVKLAGIATVQPGVGLWSTAGFMIAHATASHVFDPRAFWHEMVGLR
jgi:paraquat-inducible protein A